MTFRDFFACFKEWFEKHKQDWRIYAAPIALVILIILISFGTSSPKDFPTHTIITIQKGSSLAEISDTLASEHVINSPSWFRIMTIIFGGETGIQAGDYYLPEPQGIPVLAWRMVHAASDLTLVKITIPEGYTVKQISALFDDRFPLFNHAAFEANAPEGYLFPDTYFIQVNATASSTSSLFQSNFHIKVDPLADDIKASGHSIYNIIDVASIIQAEVKTPEDMALVSGIIWERLKLDMPLQVDSAPETYQREGLPTSPIDNPGLAAIKAAVYPTASSYLYYISDKQGNIHYAKTLDEQTANINKYL
jgi:UPF0755 protein